MQAMKTSQAINGLKSFYPFIICVFLQVNLFGAIAQNSGRQNIQKASYNREKNAGEAMVLLNNRARTIPLKSLSARKIASINMRSAYTVVFDSLLSKYAPIKSYASVSYRSDSTDINDLSDDLKFYNTVIVQVTGESLNDPETIRFIADNQKRKEIIIAGFGNLRSLRKLNSITAPIIWSTDYTPASASYAAQLVFGGIAAKGRLKQTVSTKYRSGAGYTTKKVRLRYALPEDVGIHSANLDSIDLIVAEGIREKATPSAVVMIVKDGTVIFSKAYGTHTYEGLEPTQLTDIYDLASVTKVSATTVSVMKLYEQQKINLDSTLGAYLPKARKTNKDDIRLREVLLHQSGLTPISFFANLNPVDHRIDSSYAYPVKVANGYFLRRNYFEEIMWPAILKTPIRDRGTYRYTDLNMYFMKEIVEWQSGTSLDQYVINQFYKPLGMYTAGFNPRRRFEKEQIVPTHNDTDFRKTLLQGYVHDRGAAMLGGVSGHAGLFASANDLAILYQMLLNRGSYGGEQYFKPETVDLFTSKQSAVSRRGLGFDRWDPDAANGYPSKLASPVTYGHTGFTGICVWVDPQYNLVYIFLSNRVHPEVSEKLSQLNIRGRIQDVVYEAIRKGN